MKPDDLEYQHRMHMLAAIIDSSEDAIISKDLNSRITSWNKSAERIFGYTEAEVIGQDIYLLIPEDRRKEEAMIIAQLREGRRIEHFETIRVAKNGQSLNISLTISPIKNATGEIIGASKIARDITRQKQDAALIEQYVQRLELINSVGRSIASQLDISMILQKVTDATTQLSGAEFGAFFYNKVDNTGEKYMLFTLSGAPREAFEKFGMPRNTGVFRPTFNGEGIVRSDDITKDPRYGKNFPHHGMPKGHLPVVSYLAVPVTSNTTGVIGGLFFGHSKPGMFREEHEHLLAGIAAQAATALDNAKLYEEVRALNTKKDEFIGFASHELKTPLTTITGYLQLAKEKPQLPIDIVERITKQTDRLQSIIGDLLDISKIQAGKLKPDADEYSLKKLLTESIETVSTENHTIVVELPEEDIDITVDSRKMGQVLVNLLSNAVKYSLPGTNITIAAIRVGDQIKITVQDEGIGISPQHLDKIFNQFYRVAKTSNTQGMGLGLFISKEIVHAHKGLIWAESEEGNGSTFHILFPIRLD